VPQDNPQSVNRRGCFFMLAAALLILALVGWLASQPGDRQQVNESISEGTR